ncbi:MAG: hypothetical protein WC421_00255 [Elusimicrobiales bacterium]
MPSALQLRLKTRPAVALAALLCAAPAAARSLPPMESDTAVFRARTRAPATPQNAGREAGLLVLSPESGAGWQRQLGRACAPLGRKMPVETVFGAADLRALSPALRRLAAAGVRKIIAVPAFLPPDSPELEQSRFLLGLAENPSAPYTKKLNAGRLPRRAERARNEIPVVMTQGLDKSDMLFSALLAPASAFAAVSPGAAALVVVAAEPDDPGEARALLSCLASAADAAARKAGIKKSRAALLFAGNSRAGAAFGRMGGSAPAKLSPPAPAGERARRSRAELLKAVRELSAGARTLVLGYSPDAGELDRITGEILAGAFYTRGGTVSLPEKGLQSWLEQMHRAGLKLQPGPLYAGPAMAPAGKE